MNKVFKKLKDIKNNVNTFGNRRIINIIYEIISNYLLKPLLLINETNEEAKKMIIKNDLKYLKENLFYLIIEKQLVSQERLSLFLNNEWIFGIYLFFGDNNRCLVNQMNDFLLKQIIKEPEEQKWWKLDIINGHIINVCTNEKIPMKRFIDFYLQ